MTQHTDQATTPGLKPWYRQFWPWFLIALPAISVVAGLSTLAIAILNQDSLVRDDWYKEGKAINLNMARDNAAGQLGIVADIHIDSLTGEVLAGLQHKDTSLPLPGQLLLVFTHPTRAEADQSVVLKLHSDGRYHGLLQRALQGRFDIELGDTQWRLLASHNFPLPEFTLRHE